MSLLQAIPHPGYPPGFLSEIDIQVLQERLTGKRVLELGSYLGRSTVAIARVAEHLVSVDHHRGSAEHQPGGPYHDPALMVGGRFSTLPQFLANLWAYGVDEKVTVVVASTREAKRWLRRGSFQAAFIDTEHSYETTLHDGRLAAWCVEAGGLLLFHDHSGWAGVRQAVDELAERSRQPVERCYTARSHATSIAIISSWVGA